MNLKVITGIGLALLGILFFSGYALTRYIKSQKALQAERLQIILDFSNKNIEKCTIESWTFQPPQLVKTEVSNPELFAKEFSKIIKEHQTSITTGSIPLEFLNIITFQQDDSEWIFKFDPGLDEKGVIQYHIDNDSYGIIDLDHQGTRMILAMINEALSKDIQKDKLLKYYPKSN